MSVNIEIYTNASEPEYMDKSLSNIATLTGELRTDVTEVVDPVIRVEDPGSLLTGSANYAYISEFGRYYYIRKKRSERNNIVELSMHVDVLMSFASAIKAREAIVRRQENDWNLYIIDGSLMVYENDYVYTKNFPTGFSVNNWILVAAGS